MKWPCAAANAPPCLKMSIAYVTDERPSFVTASPASTVSGCDALEVGAAARVYRTGEAFQAEKEEIPRYRGCPITIRHCCRNHNKAAKAACIRIMVEQGRTRILF